MIARSFLQLLAVMMLLMGPTGCMTRLSSGGNDNPPPPTQKDDQDDSSKSQPSNPDDFKNEQETVGTGKKILQAGTDAAKSAGNLLTDVGDRIGAGAKAAKCLEGGLKVANAYQKGGAGAAVQTMAVETTKHAISSAVIPVVTSVATTVLTDVLAPVVLGGTIGVGTGMVIVGVGTAIAGYGARYAVGKFVDHVVVPAATAGAEALGDAASHGFMDPIQNVDGMANGTPDINRIRPRLPTTQSVIPVCHH